jgi:hypothetical protein
MNSGWPGAILSPASVSAARTSGVDLAATAGLFYGGAFALVGSRLARARLPFVIVVFAEHPALGASYVLNVKVVTTRASVSSVRSHVAASSLTLPSSVNASRTSASIAATSCAVKCGSRTAHRLGTESIPARTLPAMAGRSARHPHSKCPGARAPNGGVVPAPTACSRDLLTHRDRYRRRAT